MLSIVYMLGWICTGAVSAIVHYALIPHMVINLYLASTHRTTAALGTGPGIGERLPFVAAGTAFPPDALGTAASHLLRR